MDPTPYLHLARVGGRADLGVTPRGGVTETSFILDGGENEKTPDVYFRPVYLSNIPT